MSGLLEAKNAGPSALDRIVTTQSIVGTVVETDIYNRTIPAGFLARNVLRIRVRGTWKNDTGIAATYTLAFYFGGTKMFQDASAAFSAGAHTHILDFDFDLFLVNQSLTAQRMAGQVRLTSSTQPAAGQGDLADFTNSFNWPIGGVAAVNAALEQDLRITITHGAADANLQYTREIIIVETI